MASAYLDAMLGGHYHTQILVSCVLYIIIFYTLLFTLKLVNRVMNLGINFATQIGIISRVCSFFNSTLITTFTIYVLLTESNFKSLENRVKYRPPELVLDFGIISGYLLFDLLMMLLHRKQLYEHEFLIHHFVSITGFYFCVTEGFMAFYGLYRLMSEASTIFINVRWMLLTFKLKNTKMYSVTAATIFGVFFMCRIVPIPPFWYMMYETIQSPHWQHIPTHHKFICIGVSIPLDLLNVFWFYRIVIIATKMTKTKPIQQLNEGKND